jgi:hypothetical protein
MQILPAITFFVSFLTLLSFCYVFFSKKKYSVDDYKLFKGKHGILLGKGKSQSLANIFVYSQEASIEVLVVLIKTFSLVYKHSMPPPKKAPCSNPTFLYEEIEAKRVYLSNLLPRSNSIFYCLILCSHENKKKLLSCIINIPNEFSIKQNSNQSISMFVEAL